MVQYYLSSQLRVAAQAGVQYISVTRRPQPNSLRPRNETVWPFNGTDWKDFNVKLISVQGNGVLTVNRVKNGANVGVPITFDNTDLAGTEKFDATTVSLVKGDRIVISFSDSSTAGVDPTFTTNSYLEFADGLFGF
ncbi:MAG TPA: hypothetical protein ENI23_11975 [bacterium]|nr:hypothetical protein [bacterium]